MSKSIFEKQLEEQIELDKKRDKVKVPEWFKDKFDGCTVAEMEENAKRTYDKTIKCIEVIRKAGINPCYDGVDETL